MKRTRTLPANLRRPLYITRANSGNNNNNNNNNSAATTPGAGEETASLYTYRLHVGTTQTIELTLQNPPQSPSRCGLVSVGVGGSSVGCKEGGDGWLAK